MQKMLKTVRASRPWWGCSWQFTPWGTGRTGTYSWARPHTLGPAAGREEVGCSATGDPNQGNGLHFQSSHLTAGSGSGVPRPAASGSLGSWSDGQLLGAHPTLRPCSRCLHSPSGVLCPWGGRTRDEGCSDLYPAAGAFRAQQRGWTGKTRLGVTPFIGHHLLDSGDHRVKRTKSDTQVTSRGFSHRRTLTYEGIQEQDKRQVTGDRQGDKTSAGVARWREWRREAQEEPRRVMRITNLTARVRCAY